MPKFGSKEDKMSTLGDYDSERCRKERERRRFLRFLSLLTDCLPFIIERHLNLQSHQALPTIPLLPPGLINTGNSCYLNSTLQLVTSILPFITPVTNLKEAWPLSQFENAAMSILDNLRQQQPVSKDQLKELNRSFCQKLCLYPSRSMQCGSECFRKLLEKMSVFVLDDIQMELGFMETSCPRCSKKTTARIEKDYLTMVQCPPDSRTITLNELVGHIVEETFECEHKSQRKTRNQKFVPEVFPVPGVFIKIPDLLLLEVKKRINPPGRIRISEEIKIEGTTYNLLAVMLHDGVSANSGHYRCIRRVGEKYYLFDDNIVSEVNLQKEADIYQESIRILALLKSDNTQELEFDKHDLKVSKEGANFGGSMTCNGIEETKDGDKFGVRMTREGLDKTQKTTF